MNEEQNDITYNELDIVSVKDVYMTCSYLILQVYSSDFSIESVCLPPQIQIPVCTEDVWLSDLLSVEFTAMLWNGYFLNAIFIVTLTAVVPLRNFALGN